MNLTLDELQRKMELWKEAWPELVKGALQEGTNTVAEEIKRQWSGGVVRSVTGSLVRGVKTSVSLNPLSGKVYVTPKQQYKAQVFEQGRTIQVAAGKRSQQRYGMTNKAAFLQITPYHGEGYYGRPRSVTIGARPIWNAVLTDKRPAILYSMQQHIVEGYK